MRSAAGRLRALLVRACLLLLVGLIVVPVFIQAAPPLTPSVASWIDGTRTLVWGASAVAITSLVLGVALGAASALGPPIVDSLVARFIEFGGAFPLLVLASAYGAGAHIPPVLVAAAIVTPIEILAVGRGVRTQSLALLRQPFVTAASALGASNRRLFRTHLFPYVIGTAASRAAFAATWCVGLEGTLKALAWDRPITDGMGTLSVLGGVAMTGAAYLLADELERRFSAN